MNSIRVQGRWFFVLGCIFLSACASIGPPSVPKDRFDYNAAVSESWKEQTLLNIVKLRYADMPLFMEVASIVAGYSIESSVNVTGNVFDGGSDANALALGGSGTYTDRPTITYSPITGAKFNKSFLTPIPPSALLFSLQAGWPADVFLPIALEAINGKRAKKSLGTGARPGHDDYYRVIELLAMIQRGGGLAMRVMNHLDNDSTTIMIIRRNDLSPEIMHASRELREILNLDPDADEYKVVFSEVKRNPRELALLTRSILAIMHELAGQISVPENDIEQGRVLRSISAGESQPLASSLIDVRHSVEPPEDAFVAVKYRDLWFWVSDRDYKSKRTLAYVMLLFSLTESGGHDALPLVTIPAG